MANWFTKLTETTFKNSRYNNSKISLLRKLVAGSLYKPSDMRSDGAIESIRSQIKIMRALATDSQIATALDYYATDATTVGSNGRVIWATPVDPNFKEVADIVNTKFKQWDVDKYARDHILELATIGNLYLPTTHFYREPESAASKRVRVSLDGNSVADDNFEIIASTKIDPETIIHIWQQGTGQGFILQPDETKSDIIIYPEEAVIHMALGGLLGDYSCEFKTKDGSTETYDLQFAQPLLGNAVQPTQTLNLLEDASILSSLAKVVRFVNVDCGSAEEEEIQATLLDIKSMIEQQLSLNTASGDIQSYVNPQSPNNLIYIPKVNGQEVVSVTDLNITATTDADNTLLEYYQNKKLSVMGIPKEALNFSSAEGLGGAGSVMSQRSALYANRLERIETAYKEGWRAGLNHYFIAHSLEGYVDKFELHMNPILTEMSTVNFDRRDAAIAQAQAIVELMQTLGIEVTNDYKKALTEILTEVLPQIGSSVNSWDMNVQSGGPEGEI